MSSNNEEIVDCIIVGGGISGLSSAMILAQNRIPFLLVERGDFSGSKNVSGGVLWGNELKKIVGDYQTQSDKSGWERYVTKRRLSFLDEKRMFSLDFYDQDYEKDPYQGLIVLRSSFDRWFADQVQQELDNQKVYDSFLATNILVKRIIEEPNRIGIDTGQEIFYAKSLILAEGVNNLLSRQVNLVDSYVSPDYMLVGVKEIIHLPKDVIEERFQLDEYSGLTNEFIGYATQGVEGGGFLYTNRDSLSLGLVLNIKDLGYKKKHPYDIMSIFKTHPAIKKMIRGGKSQEYSAHAVSSGHIKMIPKKLYKHRLLLSGESAYLLMNSGKAIQGMDFAMHSGVLAAQTIIEAKTKQNFDTTMMSTYQKKIEQSYIMQTMKTYQRFNQLLHHPMAYNQLPSIVCDMMNTFFSVDNKVPIVSMKKGMLLAVKKHLPMWKFLQFMFKGWRAL